MHTHPHYLAGLIASLLCCLALSHAHANPAHSETPSAGNSATADIAPPQDGATLSLTVIALAAGLATLLASVRQRIQADRLNPFIAPSTPASAVPPDLHAPALWVTAVFRQHPLRARGRRRRRNSSDWGHRPGNVRGLPQKDSGLPHSHGG